mmetsp:Transcript_22548/g.41364  ORF Transcript_22548/g.41364 Transcript_22548/m.41364 type:complete len:578 (-) Transcript_22548:146-1879(-)
MDRRSRASGLIEERSARDSRCPICTLPNPCPRHGPMQAAHGDQEVGAGREAARGQFSRRQRSDGHVRSQKVRSQSIPAQALRRKIDSGELVEFDPDRTLDVDEDRQEPTAPAQVRRQRRSTVRSIAGRSHVSLPEGSDLSRFDLDSRVHIRPLQNSSASSTSHDQALSSAAAAAPAEDISVGRAQRSRERTPQRSSTSASSSADQNSPASRATGMATRNTTGRDLFDEDAPHGRCRVCTLPNPCRRHSNPMVSGTTQGRERRRMSRRQTGLIESNLPERAEVKRMPRSKSTSAIPSKHAGSPQSDSFDAEWQTCTICFGEFSADDPPASQADPLRHGIKFTCSHSAAFHLSCLQQEAQQVRTFHCPLCRAKFGFTAFCICGAELIEMRADDPDVYGGNGVRCDHCCVNVPGEHLVYHCPKSKSDMHPNGYDVCRTCAGKEPPEQPKQEDQPPRGSPRVADELLAAALAADSQEEWQCPACTLLNEASAFECAVCSGLRPSLQLNLRQAAASLDPNTAVETPSGELGSLLQRLSTLHDEHREMQRLLASTAAETERLQSFLNAAMVANETDEPEHPDV